MRTAFEKGQKKISAKQMNYMLNAANAVHDSFLKSNGVPVPVASVDPAFVTVRNGSGKNLWSFSVLHVKEVDIPKDVAQARENALNNNIVLKGVAPESVQDLIAITFSTANKEELVYAVVNGPAYCTVNILDIEHKYAVPIPGDCGKLESSDSGSIRIMCPATETGLFFLPVLLGSPPVGAATQALRGIVIEPIRKTEDVTVDPADYTFGKVRIVGKDYHDPEKPGTPIPFDDCVNLALAETEVNVVGQTLKVSGPHKRPNPEFDVQQPESDTNKKSLEYYSVVDHDQEWLGALSEDLAGGSSTTIQMSDLSGENSGTYDFTVWAGMDSTNLHYLSGDGVAFKAMDTVQGRRLEIIGHVCPLPLDETER